jgi:hypothetical protein
MTRVQILDQLAGMEAAAQNPLSGRKTTKLKADLIHHTPEKDKVQKGMLLSDIWH